MSDFFNRDMAAAYDERNSRLSPITDNLHFLTQLVLAGLPADARILCVGVGTGAEILSLAHAFPDWSFVGVDPSLEMLDVCRRRLDRAGLSNRARLQHGYVQDLAPDLAFDGVVSLLVAHFVQREERPGFYRAIHDHLRPGGCYLSAEISTDLNDAAFPMALED
ncbi:Carboxy-S-adenosyl-L-methionine synthase [Brevundimonas sp. NIBR10]|uniref:SAM-dependent methyltransferase n=1 Tax=Brevundimonas sp. NIBR10 TaxID=3015997 RepID=UPI0022F1D386|nr:class I SAM-dependent methyltransferase [Brevundimonas sp. NIBR10]WGM45958.1 Carboxy-S-adenosyl-L-methionine synthase [Brevundimonas sp. NIBR10]